MATKIVPITQLNKQLIYRELMICASSDIESKLRLSSLGNWLAILDCFSDSETNHITLCVEYEVKDEEGGR